MSFNSSSDKVCFNKNLPIILFGVIILLGIVFFSQSLMNTKSTTKTKAAEPLKTTVPIGQACSNVPSCTTEDYAKQAKLVFNSCTGTCDDMVRKTDWLVYEPERFEYKMCLQEDGKIMCTTTTKKNSPNSCDNIPDCPDEVVKNDFKQIFDYCSGTCEEMLWKAGQESQKSFLPNIVTSGEPEPTNTTLPNIVTSGEPTGKYKMCRAWHVNQMKYWCY